MHLKSSFLGELTYVPIKVDTIGVNPSGDTSKTIISLNKYEKAIPTSLTKAKSLSQFSFL